MGSPNCAKQVFVRLDMKLPPDLKDFVRDYARQRKTTVSELIREFLQGLKDARPRQI